MPHATVPPLKTRREQAAYQFEQEALRLGFTVEQTLRNYRYVVRDTRTDTQYTAMILPSSFDYYEYRLNRGKRRVSLLIVQRHNAVVPLPVVSLSQVYLFEPLEVPTLHRAESKRRNHEEAMLLLSKLIMNFESAWEELGRMSERSRQRYERLKDHYLKGRIGRPWAS